MSEDTRHLADPERTRVLPDPEATRELARDPEATRRAGPAWGSDPERTRIADSATGTASGLRALAASQHDSDAANRALLAQAEPSAPLPPGYRLHEYRIDSVLGRGGFGITYLATDVHLDARVAIKEYLPEQVATRDATGKVGAHGDEARATYQQGLDNFLVEARTLAGFRHPHIVRVARFFEANQTAYMVLEYERGESLRSWWTRQPGLRERDLLERLMPLLDGLAVVHRAGFMHRDIKPDNIMVRAADGSLVLLDFGSAGPHGGRPDELGMLTPGYAPIEQYGVGEQGPWTDLYAFGATLYWMACGEKPLPAPTRRGAMDPLPPASTRGDGRFSAPFLAAVDRALAPAPAARPQTVAEFRAELAAGDPAALALHEALAAGEVNPSDRGHRLPFGERLRGALRRALQPASWPLAVKSMLVLVATALAPMLITAWTNLQGSLARVSEAELQNLTQIADGLAGRVSQLIEDNRKLARFLASDAALQAQLQMPETAPEPAQARLDALIAVNPDVQLAMLFDTSGTALLSSDPQVAGKSFAFRDYFRAAISGQPYTSGIIVGAVAGQAGMFFAEPVRDADGQVIGAAVLRIKGAAVSAVLQRGLRNPARTPFLVDGDGVVIDHPDAGMLYKSLAPLPPEVLARIVADKRFRREHIESLDLPGLAEAMLGSRAPGNVRFHATAGGGDTIAGHAPVAGHDWVVGVSEPSAYFAEPLNEVFRRAMLSVGAVGLFFCIVAVLISRSFLRPIRALTSAADALRRGDFEGAHVPVTRRDEVGHLARTFNVMIDVLRQRERERGEQRGSAVHER